MLKLAVPAVLHMVWFTGCVETAVVLTVKVEALDVTFEQGAVPDTMHWY